MIKWGQYSQAQLLIGSMEEGKMNGNRVFLLIAIQIVALMLGLGAFAQSPDKIEISKMNPAGLLVDKYSYMAQPYNFNWNHRYEKTILCNCPDFSWFSLYIFL
jgi:hypothetical protein